MRTVDAGPFGKSQQGAFRKAAADANAYFRRVTTIRKGDSVKWRINGFHTVTFVPAGGVTPSLLAPDASSPVSGVNDPAGAPFWFNGQPRLIFNPAAGAPAGPKTFRRGTLHNSGVPSEDGPPKPYKLTFKTKGTFRYICLIHPGMHGTVRVLGKKTAIPSKSAPRRQAKREQRILLQRAQRLTTGLGTAKLRQTAQAGNDNRDGTAIFKFFPSNLRVKTGTTVNLRMSPGSSEVHTFTFGPSNGKDAYVDQLAANFISPVGGDSGPPTLVVDPRAAYPSENPASGVPDYNGANHGNGFYNSGVLDRDKDSPLPAATRVRFTKAGSYDYLCLIHPFMHGRVTVSD